MRWTPGGRSRDLEDRRGGGGGGGFRIGGGRGGAGLGLGGLLLLLVLSFVFKQDFFSLLDSGGGVPGSSATAERPIQDTGEEPMVQFVSFVLDDAQQTWERLFASRDARYQRTRLVLFRDSVQSACGFAQSATGPFYCPGDGKVYIDLSFFDELDRRFGAPGDFAQAYVLAHEIGHHVQNLTGMSDRVRNAQRANPRMANQYSVALELQADCYAGVWGHSTAQRQILDHGDVEEGLSAAAAIGDDRLQKKSRGHVSPETFTHGTSAQRVAWFRRGLQSGDMSACDTFSGFR
jgi:uncharacterized protein